VDLPPRPS